MAGNTGPGIYKDWPAEDALFDVRHVAELLTIKQDEVPHAPESLCFGIWIGSITDMPFSPNCAHNFMLTGLCAATVVASMQRKCLLVTTFTIYLECAVYSMVSINSVINQYG